MHFFLIKLIIYVLYKVTYMNINEWTHNDALGQLTIKMKIQIIKYACCVEFCLCFCLCFIMKILCGFFFVYMVRLCVCHQHNHLSFVCG